MSFRALVLACASKQASELEQCMIKCVVGEADDPRLPPADFAIGLDRIYKPSFMCPATKLCSCRKTRLGKTCKSALVKNALAGHNEYEKKIQGGQENNDKGADQRFRGRSTTHRKILYFPPTKLNSHIISKIGLCCVVRGRRHCNRQRLWYPDPTHCKSDLLIQNNDRKEVEEMSSGLKELVALNLLGSALAPPHRTAGE